MLSSRYLFVDYLCTRDPFCFHDPGEGLPLSLTRDSPFAACSRLSGIEDFRIRIFR